MILYILLALLLVIVVVIPATVTAFFAQRRSGHNPPRHTTGRFIRHLSRAGQIARSAAFHDGHHDFLEGHQR